MRLLGIDYGTKRVGIAISSEDGRMAFPRTVLANTPALLVSILDLCAQEAAGAVVLGESTNYDGDDNPVMARIRSFKKDLEAAGVAVYLEPEFMTSAQAERIQGKGPMHDASAAALILQGFIDRAHNLDEEKAPS